MLGLVYTSSYCHTKPNIVKFGNGTAERHFDLYVEPVSNSIDLIVIYGVNIHAKFCGKFVKSNKMTPVHEMSRTGALQADKKQRILRWQSANGKYNIGNAVVEREFILSGDWQRNPGWWDLAWTSYIDKRLSLMCPAKIMTWNSPDVDTSLFLVIIHFENDVQGF